MEDEITKRELSDREDGSLVECAVCGTGYWKI